MGSRFVRPDTRTLTISGGDTLVVRKRLTAGEQRASFARRYIAGVDGAFRLNPLQLGLSLITAYLLDWSFKDEDGKTVKIEGLSIDDLSAVVDNLSPEDFAEIRAAIEQHEQEMSEERAAGKPKAGETASSAILPSPDASDGDLTGSAI